MKKLLFFLITFTILLLMTNCRGDERMDQMDIETRIKLNYFINLWKFESHFGWNEGMWFDVNNIRNRELIFVHSEEAVAAHGFPLNKVIAFPSPCTWGALNELNGMNFDFTHLAENGLCIKSLGLSFPFTIEHVVNNWNNMELFIMGALTLDEITTLRSHPNALQYRRETLDNRTLRRLLWPGRLDAINELITGRDFNNVNIERINRVSGTDFNINDLPTTPFTEDDVKNNPWLIQSILIELMTTDEWWSIEPEKILHRQLGQIR